MPARALLFFVSLSFQFFSSRFLPFLIVNNYILPGDGFPDSVTVCTGHTCDLGPLRGKVKDDGGGPFDNQREAAS